MAGSWGHMTNDDGTPYGTPYEDFGAGSMLENNDDYFEALAQCYGMVWMLAHWLLPAKATREDALALIAQAQEEYETGISLGKKTDW
jgi:hypothetical protein